jgi:hypothetical protein
MEVIKYHIYECVYVSERQIQEIFGEDWRNNGTLKM